MRWLFSAALIALVTACTGTAAPASPTAAASARPTPELDAAGLQAAFATAERLTYKIEYAINGTLQKTAVAGRWITYQRPPRYRYDVFLAGGSDEYAITTFVGPEGVLVCALGPRPPCETPDPDTASRLLGLQALDANARRDPTYFLKADRTADRIAGLPVTCFILQPKSGALTGTLATGEFCYTRDGLPLRLLARNANGDIELNAVIVLREFPPADLVPPQ